MFPHTSSTLLPTTLHLLLLLTTLTTTLAHPQNNPHILTPRQPSLLTCNQDNQLRALERFASQASTFCPTYLVATPTPTNTAASSPLPTYVSDFQAADISSACVCFQASATNTAVVLTLSATSTPTASAAGASKAISTPPPSSSSSSNNNNNNNSTKTSLSPGAKAGIGIACAILGLALIAAAVVLILLRRKRRNRTQGRESGRQSMAGMGKGVSREEVEKGGRDGGRPPAYDAVEKDAGGYGVEMGGEGRFEMEGGRVGGKG